MSTQLARSVAASSAASSSSKKAAASIVKPMSKGITKRPPKKKESFLKKGLKFIGKKLDKGSDALLNTGSKVYSKIGEYNPIYKGLGKLVGANDSGSTGKGNKPLTYKTGEQLEKLGYKKNEVPEEEKAKYHKNSLVSAGRTLHAGWGLLQDVSNPFELAKTAKNALKGKGVTLPKSSYIGPGNEVSSGGKHAKSDADAAAFAHDLDYDRSLKKGVKASHLYTGFGSSDDRLLKRANAETKQGLAVHLGIGAKKIASKIGLSKSNTD